MKKNEFVELSAQELEEVNGGNPGLIIGAAALFLAAFAFGYQVGKDRAEADRR